MNILIVSQYFWPENFRINDIAAGLVERGHSVTVLTGIPNYPSGRFFEGYGIFKKIRQHYKGMNVIRTPLCPRGKSGGIRLVLNFLSFAFFASLLAPFVCRRSFDLIFVYEPSPVTVGLPAIVLKKIKSIPIFFWVQDLWPQTLSATGAVQSKMILKWVNQLTCFIYKHCDRVLVQSKAFVEQIQKQGVRKQDILYFPNSVEKIFQSMDSENEKSLEISLPEGFCIMFAGNIGAAQDFPTIIDAAKKIKEHKDIHWIILGDGRMKDWAENKIREEGLSENVHFLGRHSVEEMPYYFSKADAMLVSLKKDPIFAMTIPAKIQSYMACGKPIIAALDGEGARLIDEARAGVTVPSENSDQLAQAVLKMYCMPEDQRRELGERGLKFCEEHFEREMLLDRFELWMKDIQSCKKNEK